MSYSFETTKDLKTYIAKEVLTTTEAVTLLGYSRQYINQLVKENKIIPIKQSGNTTLFLKSDLVKFKEG